MYMRFPRSLASLPASCEVPLRSVQAASGSAAGAARSGDVSVGFDLTMAVLAMMSRQPRGVTGEIQEYPTDHEISAALRG